MKIIFLLSVLLSFFSCTHEMEEKRPIDKGATTRGLNYPDKKDTLCYPPIYITVFHESHYTQDEVIFQIPKLYDYMNNGNGEHPEYPPYNWWLGRYCYIQYRDASIRGDRNWYYYHPDTIKSTIPYKIEIEGDTHPESFRAAIVRLRADKLPKVPFEYQGVSFGGDICEYNGKIIIPITQWPDPSYKCDPWTHNINGFVDTEPPSKPEDPGENIPDGYVDAYIEFKLTVFIHLDGSDGGGTYILKNNGEEYTFKVYPGEKTTYSQIIILEKGYRRVRQNSFNQETFTFEEETCTFNYYISNAYRGETVTASSMINISPKVLPGT